MSDKCIQIEGNFEDFKQVFDYKINLRGSVDFIRVLYMYEYISSGYSLGDSQNCEKFRRYQSWLSQKT